MKSYKDYMDRIRVDEKQHERFVKALEEAQARGTAGSAPQEEKKTIRFTPKLARYGGIAVAAMLAIVLLWGVGSRALRGNEAAAPAPDQKAAGPEQEYAVPSAETAGSAARTDAEQPVEHIVPETRKTEAVSATTAYAAVNTFPDDVSPQPAAADPMEEGPQAEGGVEPARAEAIPDGTLLYVNEAGKTKALALTDQTAEKLLDFALAEELEGPSAEEAEALAEAVSGGGPGAGSQIDGVHFPAGTAEASSTLREAVGSVFYLKLDGLLYRFDYDAAGETAQAEFLKFLSELGLTLAE